MISPDPAAHTPATVDWQAWYSVLADFDRAWNEGRRPDVLEWRGRALEAPAAFLLQLIALDLKHRLDAGEPARVEDYLARFPELAADSAALGELAWAELALRQVRESTLTAEEYAQRFPGLTLTGGNTGNFRSFASTLSLGPRAEPDAMAATSEARRGVRFTHVREHARGGLGQVSVAHDADLNRLVAYKEIRPDRLSPQTRERFLAEAEISGQLEHPGIVPIYAAGDGPDGHPYYAMRFVEGKTLADAIFELYAGKGRTRSFTSVAFRSLLQRFVTVCQTMAFAHTKGVIHRDLKPANVMLGEYGETLVLDWGLAKRVAAADGEQPETPAPPEPGLPWDSGFSLQPSSLTQAGEILGTPAYMSPEQANGKLDELGTGTDIYSLGAMLYEVLTGLPPYSGPAVTDVLAGVREGPPPRPTERRPSVPRALEAVCLRALARRPDDRYATATELAQDLERWLADAPVLAWREPLAERARRWRRRNRTFVTGVTIAIVLTILGTIVGLYLKDSAAREKERLLSEHLTTMRHTAIAQEQLGLTELRANKLANAVRLFQQGADALAEEPALADLHDRLQQRLDRTRRLVNYHQFNQQTEESIYFDLEDRTIQLVGAALAELRILEQPKWWESLPDEDLTEHQRKILRVDIHARLLLLGGVRARQGLMNFGNTEKTREGFTRGLEALAAAQRFEQTHTGDMLELYCKVGLGQAAPDSLLATDVQPTAFADFLFIGVLHQWLGRQLEDPISRFVINRINSPLIDLKTPLVTSERYLRKAITFYPDYPWTYLMLAWTLDLADKQEESELALRAQLALDPDQWFGYFSLAHAILAQRRANDTPQRREELITLAVREIQPIVDKRPSHWESYYFRGMTYLEAGKTAEAIADLEKSWQMASLNDASHPKIYTIQEYLGDAHLERKEYAEAIERFNEALRLYPKSVRLYSEGPSSIYRARGDAHFGAGNHAAALADYEQLIRLEPSAVSYFVRGEVHWLIGNLQPAIDDCTKALARNSKYLPAYEVRGQVHATRGDWARAAADFQMLVEGKPHETWPRFWLALALLGQQDQAGYQKLCTETLVRFAATEKSDQAADIALLCSFAPGAVDDPARVVALAEKLLATSKNRRERLALGAALLRAGRLQDALTHVEFAYPALPSDKKPWVLACLFRGLCEHRLSRPSEAEVWFAPARAWHDQYLKAVQAGNPTKLTDSDLTVDWQYRLQVELLLREAEAK